jgi:hypothetical protein
MRGPTQTAQELSESAKPTGLLPVEEGRARIVAAIPVLGAEKIRAESAAGRLPRRTGSRRRPALAM